MKSYYFNVFLNFLSNGAAWGKDKTLIFSFEANSVQPLLFIAQISIF